MKNSNQKLNRKEIKMFKDLAEDFIAVKFEGHSYNATIDFIKIILKRLKHQSKFSKDKIIKDILGR